MPFKILIADQIHESGMNILSSSPLLDVDPKVGLSKADLYASIGIYDAIVVGEETAVQTDLLELAPRLKVIAKVGPDLDNLDVPEATRRGVVVMNAPASYIVSAGEHTIALMAAVHRHLPAAVDSMKQGKWEKKKFQGREMAGKTLGVVGFDKTGAMVARYASRGLRMNILVHDVVVTPDTIKQQGFRPVSLVELLERSDVISLHVPLNPDTRNMLNAEAFSLMKPGVIIINTSRAGLIHENSLLSALDSGKVSGAALDVHSEVYLRNSSLLNHPKVICTPNLSVATDEARENVSKSIAESLRDYFEKGLMENAVNVSVVDPVLRTKIGPYTELARRLGMFIAGLSSENVGTIEVGYRGELVDWDLKPLTTAALAGFLNVLKGSDANLVNANLIARECGIQIHETILKESVEGRPSITIQVFSGQTTSIKVEGALIRRFGEEPRIIGIDEFVTEAIPAGPMLIVKNRDIPGMIAGISGVLARRQMNIAQMNLSRDCAGGTAMSITNLDSPADEETLGEIRKINGIISVNQIIIDDLAELNVCVAQQ
ncbi:MAG: phosphoglycerate dehydrogenase [Deltaproteobacteria bacterium]|nr:phosphoglycerate dehydrogenase [Deltaproteobacteria bacterium]